MLQSPSSASRGGACPCGFVQAFRGNRVTSVRIHLVIYQGDSMPRKPPRVRPVFSASSMTRQAGCSRAPSRPAPPPPPRGAPTLPFVSEESGGAGLIAGPVESFAGSRGRGGFLTPGLLPGQTPPPALDGPCGRRSSVRLFPGLRAQVSSWASWGRVRRPRPSGFAPCRVTSLRGPPQCRQVPGAPRRSPSRQLRRVMGNPHLSLLRCRERGDLCGLEGPRWGWNPSPARREGPRGPRPGSGPRAAEPAAARRSSRGNADLCLQK